MARAHICGLHLLGKIVSLAAILWFGCRALQPDHCCSVMHVIMQECKVVFPSKYFRYSTFGTVLTLPNLEVCFVFPVQIVFISVGGVFSQIVIFNINA